MVRYAEPSKRNELSCTQRRKVANCSREAGPEPSFCSSSHVPLIASHISVVSAVRTERAFERATSKQERIEEGLSGEKARKSVTVCSFASLCAEKNAAAQPAVATAVSHSLVVAPSDVVTLASRCVASSMCTSVSRGSPYRATPHIWVSVRTRIKLAN